MSVDWSALGPRVKITRADGTSRTLPLDAVDGHYYDIAQQPDEGFPPPLAIGPPEQRTDLRTRQAIFRSWQRGMGTDEYDETQGLTSFRDSQCETRFPNVLVCRTLPARVGSSTTVSGSGVPRVVYVGSGTAKWFCYAQAGSAPKYYSTSTSQWVATTMTNGSHDFARGAGGMYYIWDTAQKISQSSDGITWTAVDITDLTAINPASLLLYGLVVHDHKLFTMLYSGNNTTWTLVQSVDATTNPAAANWTALGSMTLGDNEEVKQLFTWKFPRDPDRPGIFALTNWRIWWYDDTADAASTTAWKVYHTWDIPYPANRSYGHALVHGGTGDLYVMPHSTQDLLWQFTGGSIARHGPNKRGGLPPSRQGYITWSMANSTAIVSWLTPVAGVGTGNAGMVAALNEQEGFHHVFDTVNTGIIGSGRTVAGGGLGPTSVLTVLDNGVVWEQDFPDTSELPQYAKTARSYDSTALYHATAKTDIGNPTLTKAALYHEMNAKIPSGASVAVAYRLDDSDQTGAWTTLGTATSADAMPYRVGFPDNTQFRQAEVRYTLTRGTATSATPIVYAGILHATLLPPARFNTQFRVTLRAEAFPNAIRQVAGYGLSNLRTWLRACHGQIVSYQISHPGGVLAVSRGQIAVSPTESPFDGLGTYGIVIRDLQTPASG